MYMIIKMMSGSLGLAFQVAATIDTRRDHLVSSLVDLKVQNRAQN